MKDLSYLGRKVLVSNYKVHGIADLPCNVLFEAEMYCSVNISNAHPVGKVL